MLAPLTTSAFSLDTVRWADAAGEATVEYDIAFKDEDRGVARSSGRRPVSAMGAGGPAARSRPMAPTRKPG